MAEHVPVEEEADIKEMLHMMDVNKKGKLTVDELKNGLNLIGHHMPEKEIEMLMKAEDIDGNGHLSCQEFAKKIRSEEHLPKAFKHFDKDGSGYIEIDELREALGGDELDANEQVILDIISDVDKDKDGRISYEEFEMMMKAGTDRRNASRQYSRAVFNTLSLKMFKDGSS